MLSEQTVCDHSGAAGGSERASCADPHSADRRPVVARRTACAADRDALSILYVLVAARAHDICRHVPTPGIVPGRRCRRS